MEAFKIPYTDVLDVLYVILSLGNIEFNSKGESILNSTMYCAESICRKLDISLDKFKTFLTHKRIVVKKEESLIPLTAAQCVANRDALAKFIYNSIFQYIVNCCTAALTSSSEMSSTTSSLRYIHLLDIYGFEVFEMNSFEQLCINYVNERMQNFFNSMLFIQEQEIYAKEGISFKTIEFQNNLECISLIDGKNGFFDLLNEELKLTKPSAKNFVSKMNQHNGNNPCFYRPRIDSKLKIHPDETVGIKHFAQSVVYHCVETNFLEKNDDTLSPPLLELLHQSKFAFIFNVLNATPAHATTAATHTAATYAAATHAATTHAATAHADSASAHAAATQTAPAHADSAATQTAHTPAASTPAPVASHSHSQSHRLTVAKKFLNQVNDLLKKLESSTPHFIRCIKPNNLQKPNLFSGGYVKRQLKSLGMFEAL